MRTLIIDNYDSFTYNIYQLIAEINKEKPLVITNNQLSWQEIKEGNFDNIIISPGPGNPERKQDFGVCQEVLLNAEIPILGICLGHQGLGYYYGEKIIKANEPYHGRISKVYHEKDSIFCDIPSPFSVVRYHSLIINNHHQKSNSHLEVIARTEDNIIMGIKHNYKPYWGVQFHPESICSEFGKKLLVNFNNLTEKYYYSQGKTNVHYSNNKSCVKFRSPLNPLNKGGIKEDDKLNLLLNKQEIKGDNKVVKSQLRVFSKKLDLFIDSERVFDYFYKESQYCFWLDSSLVEDGLSRFSYMGNIEGENSFLISYDVHEQIITKFKQKKISKITGDIFTFLQEYLDKNSCDSEELPFNFQGGFVGYFGFELKALCGYNLKYKSPHPDAQFLFVDRMIVFDHLTRNIYLTYLGQRNDYDKASHWFEEVENKLSYLITNNIKKGKEDISRSSQNLDDNNVNDNCINNSNQNDNLSYQLSRNKQEYLDNINICLDKILQGESYEICLTNHLYLENLINPLDFYFQLRKENPAPYSCYFKWDNIYIACSSPERFLRLEKNGDLESKPIKGTVKRGKTKAEDNELKNRLKCSEKERAENLMIVDLLRNDLGKVCQVGSVHVPKLMAIESYSTVHQMVSTVKGKIREGIKATDCIKACFPGGSMTGAPKKRTLEIIDELETEARGIYSGCIGFLGVNGTMDLNIVIRTAIASPEKTAIGVGGAITYLSSAEEEFAETILKAKALLDVAKTINHE